MTSNYDENALLESSGIALLFNIRFYATIVIEFVLHHRFSAIVGMQIIPTSKDVQRL